MKNKIRILAHKSFWFSMRTIGSDACGWIFLLGLSQPAVAGTFENLTQEEQNQILNHKPVVHASQNPDHPHSAWPRYQIFQMIQANPEECAAVFFDFQNQKNYMPNMLEAKVIQTGKNTIDTISSVRLPLFLGIETHTVHEGITADQGNYFIQWLGVPNSSYDYSDGSALFEPFREGQTLLTYTNFVEPIRSGAGLDWVVEGAKTHLTETVQRIIDQIEKEKSKSTPELDNEIEVLRRAVDPNPVNEASSNQGSKKVL